MSALSRVYVHVPAADDLVVGARFYWRGRRHGWFLRLDRWYKVLCRLGLHVLHDSFSRDMRVCSCGRNFLYMEDIR